jgi:glycosyltransferase involved in cell wall biosynthesis
MFRYIAPYNTTGYGVASVGYLNEINKITNDYYVNVISDPVPVDEDLYGKDTINVLLRYSNTKFDLQSKEKPPSDIPSFIFWHLFDIHDKILNFEGKKIALTTFEVNELSDQEIKNIDKLDKIGTCTDWGLSILSKYVSQDKLFKLPHAFLPNNNITLKIEKPDRDRVYSHWLNMLKPVNLPKNIFTISTSGKFESRKGHPELLDACIDFSKKVAPILIIASWTNFFLYTSQPYGYLNSLFFEPIYTANGLKLYKKDNCYLLLLPFSKSRLNLHTSLLSSDVYFSPSKGEGWDLPLFEMMTYGMPCAATLCSAHTEYCTKDNVIPIEHGGLVPAFDGMFFNGSTNWYSVTKESIFNSLTNSYSLIGTDKLKQIGSLAEQTAKAYTWESGAKKIVEMMTA